MIEDEESEDAWSKSTVTVFQGASLTHKHPHWESHQMKGFPKSSLPDYQEEKQELKYYPGISA